MKKALLFDENSNRVLVTADEVKEGKYSRNSEFVDPEYEFKVRFVSAAKNNGGPYFRLYYSYEDYKRLYPDRADRYQIVANMRRFYESQWHKHWKELFAPFSCIEHYIKDPSEKKWKYADAYLESQKTCVEFQHSYIADDFEERNKFYKKLGIKTVWLYDLTDAAAKECDDGLVEILENNSKGFFRISETPANLSEQKVFIQVKSRKIFRVNELKRRDSSVDLKSTIRCFVPSEVYSEFDFVEAVLTSRVGINKVDPFSSKSSNGSVVVNPNPTYKAASTNEPRPWKWVDPPYSGRTSIIDFFKFHSTCETAVFRRLSDHEEVQVYKKDIYRFSASGYFLKYSNPLKVEIFYADYSGWICIRCAYVRQS